MFVYERPFAPSDGRIYDVFGRDPMLPNPSKFVSSFISLSGVSPNVCVVSLHYLDVLHRKHPGLPFTTNNANRLVHIACVAAAKYIDDQAMRYTNVHW